MKNKVFIDGEYGTTGLQIKQRLQGRGDIECVSVKHEDRHDIKSREEMLRHADFAILCLPNEGSLEAVEMIGDKGTRVIDASTAHRVNDEWVFGFIELEENHKEKIKNADRVANPGCYSTGAIGLIRPLTQNGVMEKNSLVSINAVSGYSGGGKGLIEKMESNEIDVPYYIYATQMQHKHVAEITKYSLLENAPLFSPAVGRFPQGMIVQVPLHLSALNAKNKNEVLEVMKEHYKNSENVNVMDKEMERIDPVALVGEDKMEIYVCGNDEHVNLVALLDNLGKGASGACVQALELMMGNQ